MKPTTDTNPISDDTVPIYGPGKDNYGRDKSIVDTAPTHRKILERTPQETKEQVAKYGFDTVQGETGEDVISAAVIHMHKSNWSTADRLLFMQGAEFGANHILKNYVKVEDVVNMINKWSIAGELTIPAPQLIIKIKKLIKP